MKHFEEYGKKMLKATGEIALYGAIVYGVKKIGDYTGIDFGFGNYGYREAPPKDKYVYSTARTVYRSSRHGYSDAIRAITESDMFSCDKQNAIACIARDESFEYYDAIIAIADDHNQFSKSRYNAIKDVCRRTED